MAFIAIIDIDEMRLRSLKFQQANHEKLAFVRSAGCSNLSCGEGYEAIEQVSSEHE